MLHLQWLTVRCMLCTMAAWLLQGGHLAKAKAVGCSHKSISFDADSDTECTMPGGQQLHDEVLQDACFDAACS